MATLPRASVVLSPTAITPGGGVDLICVLAPVASNADLMPRQFGSADAIVAQHGYSEGAEYAALHIQNTQLPVVFIGMPIGTAGVVSRKASHTNTGTSVVDVAAGADGVLAEHDGILKCAKGGTIGTDQIQLNLSLDGGRTYQPQRLGTANSLVLPNVNVTATFAAGTLVAGDTLIAWHGTGPKHTPADLTEARTNLANSDKLVRSLMLVGDLPDKAGADSYVAELNAMGTANDRDVYGRAGVFDRLPLANMSNAFARLTDSAAQTFATAGDTITRSSGSWLADGFAVGDTIEIADTPSNNGTFTVAAVTASVLTTNENLVDETATATITGGPTLTFTNNGATGDTITRSRGSWLEDGFRAGGLVDVSGSTLNDFTGELITGVTDLVLTFDTASLTLDTDLASDVTVTEGETKAAWMARADGVFAGVDAERQIDLSAGRGAEPSPYSGWQRRCPIGWAASIREYQNDLHVATWRKNLGPIGFDLFDANNDLVEWDDRVDGAAGVAARFTVARTWANGPRGTFIAQSLTRAGDGKIESQTHNNAIINLAMNVVRTATEEVVGRSPTLNDDGTATTDALALIASEVNSALEVVLLANTRGQGARTSRAVWTPNPADIYNVAEPTMNGVLDINLNGTIHSVVTQVRVRTNGA